MTATELRADLQRADELARDPERGPWAAFGYLKQTLRHLIQEAEREEERKLSGHGHRAVFGETVL